MDLTLQRDISRLKAAIYIQYEPSFPLEIDSTKASGKPFLLLVGALSEI